MQDKQDPSLDAILEEASIPLVMAWEALKNKRGSLIEQVEMADEGLKRIERSLRPLRPELFEQPKPASRPVKKPHSISSERWTEALVWLDKAGANANGSYPEITQKMLREATGCSASMSTIIFARLRERELVRLVRMDGSLRIYKLISREALHNAIEMEDRAAT